MSHDRKLMGTLPLVPAMKEFYHVSHGVIGSAPSRSRCPAIFASSIRVDLAPACKTLECKGVLLRMLEESAGQAVIFRARRQRQVRAE